MSEPTEEFEVFDGGASTVIRTARKIGDRVARLRPEWCEGEPVEMVATRREVGQILLAVHRAHPGATDDEVTAAVNAYTNCLIRLAYFRIAMGDQELGLWYDPAADEVTFTKPKPPAGSAAPGDSPGADEP